METEQHLENNKHARALDKNVVNIIDKINELLMDPIKLCINCEAMKCYGVLFPICEPVLTLLKKIIQDDNVK